MPSPLFFLLSPLSSRAKRAGGGFTLVELVISIAIFAMMTALVVVKYGNFNQSVLMTNLAYDIAMTLRMAQTYGIGVQGQGTGFNYPYGVSFCQGNMGGTCNPVSVKGVNTVGSNTNQVTFFIDANSNGIYDNSDPSPVSTYTIKRGAYVSGVCAQSKKCDTDSFSSGTNNRLVITFKRPDPSAIINLIPAVSSNSYFNQVYGGIRIGLGSGPNSPKRYINIQQNGMISVLK